MLASSLFKQRALFTSALVAGVIGQATAASAIVETYSVERKNENGGATILTLEGSGFGEKEQAAPVLWVFGTDIRQNGKELDDPLGDFGDSVADHEFNVWAKVNRSVVYHPQSRYPELGHSYFAGNVGTVRNPLAFGGEAPPYADKIYLSARVKPVEAWHGFRSIGFSSTEGNFLTGPSRYEAGETATLTHANGIQQIPGRIIHIDYENNLVTLKRNGKWGKSDLNGATVIGDTSGARMLLSTDHHYNFATGSKYFRMWSGDKPGLYSTMTTNRLIVGYRDSSGDIVARPRNADGSWDKGYDIPDLTAKLDWRLLETFIDQEADSVSIYLDVDNSNRRYVRNLDTSDVVKFTDRSPTISQLGLDASGGAQTVDAALNFGEIYFDTSPKRVMLSNKPTYSETGTELELQFPVFWSNEKVKFELRSGKLDISSKIYAYIFDENSNPNQEGIEICVTCKLSAPKEISLDIE